MYVAFVPNHVLALAVSKGKSCYSSYLLANFVYALFLYINMSIDTLIAIVEMLLEESVTLTRQTRKRKLEEKLDQVTVVTSQVGK